MNIFVITENPFTSKNCEKSNQYIKIYSSWNNKKKTIERLKLGHTVYKLFNKSCLSRIIDNPFTSVTTVKN